MAQWRCLLVVCLLVLVGVDAGFREDLQCTSVADEASAGYTATCSPWFELYFKSVQANAAADVNNEEHDPQPYAVDVNLDQAAADAEVVQAMVAFADTSEPTNADLASEECVAARQRLQCVLSFPLCVREGQPYPLFPCRDVCIAYYSACKAPNVDACETYPLSDCVPLSLLQETKSAACLASLSPLALLITVAVLLL